MNRDMATRVALRGLSESALRVSDADGDAATVAVGQALFWAIMLDDRLAKDGRYRTLREQHPDGILLIGLRAARNAIAHGATVVMFPSMQIPEDPPVVARAARWALFSDVNRGLSKQPSAKTREVWEKSLEGQNAAATMHAVHTWLDRTVDSYGDVLASMTSLEYRVERVG